MMLHEAVMLEIYRQALSASELASPRCLSRESIASAVAGDGRCPSNESHCSGNDNVTPGATPTTTSPPVGLPLPATLAPAAAAALLPQQSAAMAAYLNAAAAAAQQNHLLLTNPLAAAASLVQQATQAHSPSAANTFITPHSLGSPVSNDMTDASALDFSTKRLKLEAANSASDEEEADTKSNNEADNGGAEAGGDAALEDTNSPLDLSLNAGRKRASSDDEPPPMVHKITRNSDYKPSLATDTWVPPINPYLAAVAAATLSPKTPLTLDWNSKGKITPNEATKALEKMTEMTRLGAVSVDKEGRQAAPAAHATGVNSSAGGASGGRHSAWQSHWLNKGADAVKDVFKCVWCKQSFATLASLTTHMKETQHCGVNVPPNVAGSVCSASSNNSASQSNTALTRHSSNASHNTSSPSSGSTSSAATTPTHTTSSKSELNLLIKETMPLPRKLVRGQDVWLGKGAEQTRQILKCMWCGQSFRSLAEMTSHMQETQHYTNIISQEQIISWKSADEKGSNMGSANGAAAGAGAMATPAVTPPAPHSAAAVNNSLNSPSNATVSAVLTCKVCDQAFSSLKELSNHMVKNSHYKEHMLRTTSHENSSTLPPSRRARQTREKRKKSLPVRKLLELERAQQDFKNNSLDTALKPLRDFAASTKITCEKCGDKIETALFVDHIRLCLGGSIPLPPRNNSLKSPYPMALGGERLRSPKSTTPNREERKASPATSTTRSEILYPPAKEVEKNSSATPSVLNAIEQLIEKSFDTKQRSGAHGGAAAGGSQMSTPLGSSILKRLGIDDNIDYTKPLMDTPAMHFLRSYSSGGYGARDRSASESSSVSERCSSRLESVTPERNPEQLSRQTTPRLSPDRAISLADTPKKEAFDARFKVKSEPVDNNESTPQPGAQIIELPKKISVKKEFSMSVEDVEEIPLKRCTAEIHNVRNALTPGSGAVSPSLSERSVTPKSTVSVGGDKKHPLSAVGGSLNALSNMFDNLNNMNMNAAPHTNNNNSSNIVNTIETNNNITAPSKKTNANPLAALQKLCETTDPPAANTRSSHAPSHHAPLANHAASAAASSMVNFSWACNDAVLGATDAIIKCSYCDTPFCSKGAYRHHLSKVHFVKDDADSQSSSSAMRSPGLATSPKSIASSRSASKSPAAQRQVTSPIAIALAPTVVATTTTNINPIDESAQSKFLKYTELAKQLSSKNV